MKQKKADKEQEKEDIKIKKTEETKQESKKEKISIENNVKKDKESKQIPQESLKDIFKSIMLAICVIIYFTILNFIDSKIEQTLILNIVEICSGVLLLTSLVLLEVAYKKDSGKFTILGIELLVLAFHSLSIKYVITRYDYQFQFYLLTSSYVISIYYILKAIVIYTKGRKKYLDTLSDIPEILKKDEPIKKEAKKRNEVDEKTKTTQHKTKSIKRETKKNKIGQEKEDKIKKIENKKTTKKVKTKQEDIDSKEEKDDEKISKSVKRKKEKDESKQNKQDIEKKKNVRKRKISKKEE